MKTSIPPSHEHPFAQFVRILGKGKKGSRSLTQEEAFQSMSMIMNGEAEDVQLGAFLMLLRVKEESPEELVGFVNAVKKYCTPTIEGVNFTLDWSSYAGKRRHLPWYLLAVFALAEKGIDTFMHGAAGHTIDRIYTEEVLRTLGFAISGTWEDVVTSKEKQGFAYYPLQSMCPKLSDIINLRNTLGLRSPVHTLARLINPTDAPFIIQGIFHPAYQPSHQAASSELGYQNALVIKGEAGEIERNPDTLCHSLSISNGNFIDETWPKMFEKRHLKESSLDISHLADVWSGTTHHEYGIAAAKGTIALALKLTQKATTQNEALAMANDLWEERDKSLI
ncbi:MAG: glycosyl transferase family protein [Pseudomonadales bacterium]|nr:glycosyl transferase family protein [Pseudomonadales bacterium]